MARFEGQVRTEWLREAGADRRMRLLEDFVFVDPGTEAARDFLLDFDHADITFDKVIVKGDAEVIEKGKDLKTEQVEPVGQVERFGSFGTAAFSRRPAGGRLGIGGEGLGDNRLISVVDRLTA